MKANDNSSESTMLPKRLFQPDSYPDGRVNVYSKPNLLSFVHEKLRGTPSWETIRTSSFGHLFNLPVTRCYISCKLIHGLLSRQLVTKRKYELWTVFGSQPIKFSLQEFELVTRLNCTPFPEQYDHESDHINDMGKVSTWEKFIGPNKDANIGDIVALLEDSEDMNCWRRTDLALLLIIEGMLIANNQGNKSLTPKYVHMLGNKKEFLNFPWGRESYLKTISSTREKARALRER